MKKRAISSTRLNDLGLYDLQPLIIKSAVVQDLTVGGIKNFVSESIVTYWRVSGAISNSLDVKGVRFRMYQNADKHLGYYESEQPAFFYGECETALSINVLFKTEENALHFDSHLRNESITVKSPMNSPTINSCVSTTSTAPLGERIYYKDHIDLLILKENEKQRIASKTIAGPDNIITKAFRPLGRRQLYSSAKSTTRLGSIYGIQVKFILALLLF